MKYESYWLDNEYTPRDSLERDIEADVVVVGGGITGVSAAYHAVKAGFKTVLIEKNSIASGSAGKNGGMVVEGLHIDLVEAVKDMGPETALNLWQGTVNARDYVVSLIHKHGINCDFLQEGSFYFAKGSDDTEYIEKEFNQRIATGLSGKLIEQFPTHKKGIFVEKDCSLHPVKFIRGLLDIAEKEGLLVFENTQALLFNKNFIKTDKGTVYAKRVVIAVESDMQEIETTNAIVKRELAMVTDPLPKEFFENMKWEKGGMFWNTGYDYVPVRKIQNRLLFNDSVSLNSSEQDLQQCQKRAFNSFFKLFPNIPRDQIFISHFWTGLLLYPKSNKPTIREKEGQYEIFGSGGNGLTNGIMLGKTLVDYFCGESIPDMYKGS